MKRIAMLGAESSGKSTLCEALARRHASVLVPEYLREFVDTMGRVPFEEDQFDIARTQRAREDAAALQARDYLFCDTTPLMTALYSRVYWGRVDAQLTELARTHDYALTLVTAPTHPGHRMACSANRRKCASWCTAWCWRNCRNGASRTCW